MKKILLFASALAGLFFAASCQQENLEPQAGQQVTFTIEAPAAMQTKAIADGLNVDELIYEVWITGQSQNVTDLSGATKLYQAKTDKKTVADGKVSFKITLDLVNDQNFTVLFWAQKKDINVYNTANLTGVTYTSTAANAYSANDNQLDAFYGKAFVSDGQTATPTVTLKRPFAQVNLCTLNNKDAAQTSDNYNISLVSSKMALVKVPTVFNVATSAATEEKPMEFAANTVPSGDDKMITVNGKEYFYAGMNYVFAGSNITLTYDIQTKLNGTVDANINNTIQNVPLKENYRTNIVGNLLTSKVDYEIIVDAAFNEPAEVVAVWDGSSVTEPTVERDATTGESVYVVDEASDLAWLAQLVNGPITRAAAVQEYDFKLTADIDLGNHPWTPIGFNPNDEAGNEKYFTGTFDGNGHTIKNLYIDVKDQGGVGFFGAIHNATIKNVTFENVFVKAVESENDPANTSGAEGKSNYIVGGHMGAVAGYDAQDGEITFDNVHVKGLVKIEGETRAAQGQRIGGIFGGRRSSNITFNNVSVKGTEGSYIKGYCSTAGVSGQIQGVATYNNVHTDIDVHAVTFGVGGIAGIVRHASSFTNCSSAGDLTLDASHTQLSSYSANYPYRVGGIAGCWSEGGKTGVLTLTECKYTGTLTSIDKEGNSPEAFDYAGYVGRGYSLNGCAGSKVSINGVEYVQVYDKAADAGLYYVNGEYTIASAANLKVFANKVNAGEDYFAGKTIKLGADIDLKNVEWTPIGSAAKDHGFMGNFDGIGHTIKNLKMTALTPDSDGYAYAGLFGVTEGTETQENYIKNLIIENVTIETTGDIAAAAIAYPYYTTVENVTVNGNINIKGGNYTAGVLAYTRRCVNAKDITISANANSVIEGNITVGGVISDIQMNGGLTANYSNFTAEGLTIKGVKCVGGISGIIGNQTLDGATVNDVALISSDIRTGIIAGAKDRIVTIKNVSYDNVTGATHLIGASYDGTVISVATADELIDALEKGKGVYFENNIKIEPASMSNAYGTTGINIKNGQTIDGNGHTLNIQGAGGTWDSGINTTGGLIKNLTVTGSFRGIFINHTSDHSEKVVLENVTITETTYTISCDQGLYQGIEATNCTFNGWTSFAKTAGEAKFVNCSFGEGSGYKYCRPYSNTEFVKCTFCPGYAVDTTRATVTFTDCTWEE